MRGRIGKMAGKGIVLALKGEEETSRMEKLLRERKKKLSIRRDSSAFRLHVQEGCGAAALLLFYINIPPVRTENRCLQTYSYG